MSDMKIRPVKIYLDKERNLLFDANALEELENIYENEPAVFVTMLEENEKGEMIEKQVEVISLIQKALEALGNSPKKVRHIKNFLYAGLFHEDSSLTPAKVGALLTLEKINVVTDQIWIAISQQMPDAKEGSDDTSGET